VRGSDNAGDGFHQRQESGAVGIISDISFDSFGASLERRKKEADFVPFQKGLKSDDWDDALFS
jgi:hypothetical protein